MTPSLTFGGKHVGETSLRPRLPASMSAAVLSSSAASMSVDRRVRACRHDAAASATSDWLSSSPPPSAKSSADASARVRSSSSRTAADWSACAITSSTRTPGRPSAAADDPAECVDVGWTSDPVSDMDSAVASSSSCCSMAAVEAAELMMTTWLKGGGW